jgi:hypothetical protein
MTALPRLCRIIYGLYDPTDPEVKTRYVGGTRILRGEQRKKAHVYEAKHSRKNHRHNWIVSLLNRQVEPQIRTLECVYLENWEERERWWIASFPRGQLVNSTAGGEGVLDLAPESKARIGAASSARMMGNTLRRNTTLTQAEKDTISAGLLASEKAAAAWERRKGQPSYERTEETRRKNSEASTGRPRPDVSVRLKETNQERFEQTTWVTDGVNNQRLKPGEPIPDDWVVGFTNENHHLRGKSNPEWSAELKKQAKRRKGKMRWITDGVSTKMWMPGDVILEGWRFGKTFKTKRGEDGRFRAE